MQFSPFGCNHRVNILTVFVTLQALLGNTGFEGRAKLVVGVYFVGEEIDNAGNYLFDDRQHIRHIQEGR